MIDVRDRYLDDVTSNYTLLAPNNAAIHKMLNFTSPDFWQDVDNVFQFIRCVTNLILRDIKHAETYWNELKEIKRFTLNTANEQGHIHRGEGQGAKPPSSLIVDWVDFLRKKPALLGLFSLPKVFCGPQMCQKCVGGRGSARTPPCKLTTLPRSP